MTRCLVELWLVWPATLSLVWPATLSLVGQAALSLVWHATLSLAMAAEDAALDPNVSFRTDSANAQLAWYQPRPGEFPPLGSEHRVRGELVSVDFIHRAGQFRAVETGELVDFSLPPYGSIGYLNAEADLRDIPLGGCFLFFLHQDTRGRFARLAMMQDQFTVDARQGISYRLDAIQLGERKLLTTKHSVTNNQPDLGKHELLLTDQTRVWKGDGQASLADLAVGDELLFNLTGQTSQSAGVSTDVWAGEAAHKLATERQRKKHADFVRARGVPGWIDQTEGNKLTVTLFSGDASSFHDTYLRDFNPGKELSVVVANDELRTWNPPVDKERCSLLEIQKLPVGGYGASGVRLVFTAANMLEGFRRGRIVRVFGAGWPIKDQFYGESLMGYGYGKLQTADLMESPPKEYPAQFPFRTDYGNEQLPWYQLRAGVVPPRYSEHLAFGELVKAQGPRAGLFRLEGAGESVDIALIPDGTVHYLTATVALPDVPPGTRCRLHLYQNEQGVFNRASLVSDEFSYLAQSGLTYRIEAISLADGKLGVAHQMPEVKNYNGDMERPPDIGRAELRVSAATRVWKGEQQASLADLAVGDLVLVNRTGEFSGAPSRCADIWIGADTHQLVADQHTKNHPAAKK